jgi:hypothetical protein
LKYWGAREIWLEGDIVRPSEGEKNAICPLQEIFLYEKTTQLAIVWPGGKGKGECSGKATVLCGRRSYAMKPLGK